jgi:hypothetical protein
MTLASPQECLAPFCAQEQNEQPWTIVQQKTVQKKGKKLNQGNRP